MASELAAGGRLIALEGSRGSDLTPAAKDLLRHLVRGKQRGGISAWDASGIFYELRKGERNIPQPSPRTLLLLYAADLVFRLRWEIRPALEEGMVVIATPYLETAVAFGKAAGLPRRWLADLLDFAPRPADCYRLKEKKDPRAWKFKRSEGYLEFCCKTLLASSPTWHPEELREKFIGYLDALEDRGGCRRLTEKLLGK